MVRTGKSLSLGAPPLRFGLRATAPNVQNNNNGARNEPRRAALANFANLRDREQERSCSLLSKFFFFLDKSSLITSLRSS